MISRFVLALTATLVLFGGISMLALAAAPDGAVVQHAKLSSPAPRTLR